MGARKKSPQTPAWPKCPACDGPAKPKGAPSLKTQYACETKSELNSREHWATKTKRKQRQGDDTTEALAVALAKKGQSIPKKGPWCVRFTRVSRGKLDDADNLPAAFKRIRDVVAAAIKVNDGAPQIRWLYEQTKGKSLGVKLEIWSWRDTNGKTQTIGSNDRPGHDSVHQRRRGKHGATGSTVRWTVRLCNSGRGT